MVREVPGPDINSQRDNIYSLSDPGSTKYPSLVTSCFCIDFNCFAGAPVSDCKSWTRRSSLIQRFVFFLSENFQTCFVPGCPG